MYHRESLKIEDLSSEQFEELIYELVSGLGFKNLVWNDGGKDGGRDLEAEYIYHNPAGKTETQKWYIDAKNYSRGVPFEKIYPTLAQASVTWPDYLYFAVYPHLTPECKEKLETHKAQTQGGPKIDVWEGKEIEEMVYSQPAVLKRFFPSQWSAAYEADVYLTEMLKQIQFLNEKARPVWSHVEQRPFTDTIDYYPQPGVPSVEAFDMCTKLDDLQTRVIRASLKLYEGLSGYITKTLGLPSGTTLILGSWPEHPEVKIVAHMRNNQIIKDGPFDGVCRIVGGLNESCLDHLRKSGIIAAASFWHPAGPQNSIRAYVVDMSEKKPTS